MDDGVGKKFACLFRELAMIGADVDNGLNIQPSDAQKRVPRRIMNWNDIIPCVSNEMP